MKRKKHVVVSVNLPVELKRWLDEQAEKEGRSVSNLLARLLEQLRAAQK
jgi:predicted transcriptional regulator